MAESGVSLTIRVVDDGLVLAGALDGDDVAVFRAELDERVATRRFVRLDMREVTTVDGEALRVLVAATGGLRSRDGDLVLDGLRPDVAALVEVSGLSWLLTTIDVSAPSATLGHGVS